MTSAHYFLILFVLLAVALDLYFVAQRHKGEAWVTKIAALAKRAEPLKNYIQNIDLATWLFVCAIALYLATRLIGLGKFPIYFFSDEAIQSLSAFDLVNNRFRNPADVLLPTYFKNGEYYNIGLSVYLQILPILVFGKSAIATRAASVLVTLIAAVSVGVVLRDVFKVRYWWTGTLFLSITPSWFLHSRTAFETAEFVAFYAGTLCAYLLYRYKTPRYLYLTIFLGALAFYTYGAAQMIVPLTAIGFLLSDWRYHWEHRRTVLPGLIFAAVLSIPYWRFRLSDPDAQLAHLHMMFSYWTTDLPLGEKISRYIREYAMGLSPSYWYIPNTRDLPRHLMKDYGHIMIATLPLAVLGMVQALGNIRQSAYRAILIAMLVSPTAAALVATSITRALVFAVLAAILTSLGLEQVMQWVASGRELPGGPGERPELTTPRIAATLIVVALGIAIAWIGRATIDRLTAVSIAILLALQVSGASRRILHLPKLISAPTVSSKRMHTFLGVSVFVVLASANVYMLHDSLKNGPFWYQDYGLRGMQYGAFQMFDLLDGYIKKHPESRVIFSADWANGTDELSRFFLGDTPPIEIGSVRGHIDEKLPLDENTLFVVTPAEFDELAAAGKFEDIEVVKIVPFPNGQPGFYFVKLRYVDNIDEIFAAEKAARQVLREATIVIESEPVQVKFTYLDSDFQEDSMALVFDGDPYTLAKSYKTNPFVMELNFLQPRSLHGFSIVIGSANVQVTLYCYSTPEAEPVTYTFQGQGLINEPELSFELPTSVNAEMLRLEVQEIGAPEDQNVHIWELTLH